MIAAVGAQSQLGLVRLSLELLGADMGHWQSSNATAAQAASNQTDHLSGSTARLLLQPGWQAKGRSSTSLYAVSTSIAGVNGSRKLMNSSRVITQAL